MSLYPLRVPVDVNILEGGHRDPTKQLVFGPPKELLGDEDAGQSATNDHGDGGSRSAAPAAAVRRLNALRYVNAHESMLREEERRREKYRRKRAARQQRREQAKEVDAADANTAAPSAELPVEPVVGSKRPAEDDDVAQGEEAPAFEPSCELEERARQRDYQGRSFIEVPSAFKAPANPVVKPPAKQLHVYRGHSSGIQALSWVSPQAHLLFSADLKGEAMLWDVFGDRNRVAVYRSHNGPCKNATATTSGDKLATSGVDGYIRQWDTVTGELVNSLSYKGHPCGYHVQHPDPAQSDVLLAAFDKRVVLFDTRLNNGTKIAREWDGHTMPVMNLTFVDGGQHFISTAEDKSIRTWDFRVAVPIRVVADVGMHAIPHCVDHPQDGTVACNSFDNKVHIFKNAGQGKLVQLRDRAIDVGHIVSGTACRLSTSCDGELISSGDASGQLHIWNYKNGKPAKKAFRAHNKVLVAHLWHPIDPTRIATSSWDGLVKMWA